MSDPKPRDAIWLHDMKSVWYAEPTECSLHANTKYLLATPERETAQELLGACEVALHYLSGRPNSDGLRRTIEQLETARAKAGEK
jgi:hypothetical protein